MATDSSRLAKRAQKAAQRKVMAKTGGFRSVRAMKAAKAKLAAKRGLKGLSAAQLADRYTTKRGSLVKARQLGELKLPTVSRYVMPSGIKCVALKGRRVWYEDFPTKIHTFTFTNSGAVGCVRVSYTYDWASMSAIRAVAKAKAAARRAANKTAFTLSAVLALVSNKGGLSANIVSHAQAEASIMQTRTATLNNIHKFHNQAKAIRQAVEAEVVKEVGGYTATVVAQMQGSDSVSSVRTNQEDKTMFSFVVAFPACLDAKGAVLPCRTTFAAVVAGKGKEVVSTFGTNMARVLGDYAQFMGANGVQYVSNPKALGKSLTHRVVLGSTPATKDSLVAKAHTAMVGAGLPAGVPFVVIVKGTGSNIILEGDKVSLYGNDGYVVEAMAMADCMVNGQVRFAATEQVAPAANAAVSNLLSNLVADSTVVVEPTIAPNTTEETQVQAQAQVQERTAFGQYIEQWSNNADPAKRMALRNTRTWTEILQLDRTAIKAIWGDSTIKPVTGTAGAALLSIMSMLAMRGKGIQWPVRAGELFTMHKEVDGNLLLKTLPGYRNKGALEALKAGKVVLVSKANYESLCAEAQKENCKTGEIRLVQNNWCAWYDFWATKEDVVGVFKFIVECATTLNKGFTLYDEGDDTVIRFGSPDNEFVVTDSGVFNRRGQRFYCTLVAPANKLIDQEGGPIPGNELVLLSSHGTFLYYVLRNVATCENAPALYRGLCNGKYGVSIANIDEVGTPNADREHYERYVTRTVASGQYEYEGKYGVTQYDNWGFNAAGSDMRSISTGDKEVRYNSPDSLRAPKHQVINKGAFDAFRLVRNHRGYLIDGRKVCAHAADMPAEFRWEFVQAILAKAYPHTDVYTAAKQRYAELVGDDDQTVRAWLESHMILLESNKANKLVKRCIMDCAVVASSTTSETRGVKQFGQDGASDVNVRVKAVLSKSLIHLPGVAEVYTDETLYWQPISWSEKLPYVAVEKLYSGNEAAAMVSLTNDGDRLPFCDLVFKPVSLHKFPNRMVARYGGNVTIKMHQAVASMPCAEQGSDTFVYTFNSRVDECVLDSITWGYTNVGAARQAYVEVAVKRPIRAGEVKYRNSPKAMGVRSPGANHPWYALALSRGVEATHTFYADTLKGGDRVFGAFMEAMFATIDGNAEHAKVAELVDLRNKYVAIYGGNTEVVEINAILAATEEYQALVAKFDEVFGRPVVVRHTGPSIALVRMLRQAPNGRIIDGWHEISQAHATLQANGYHEALIPVNAENVLVIARGSTGDDVSNTTDLTIFYTLNGEEVMVQRGWSYAGSADCPVYQPVKCELSSVIDGVGTSNQVGGLARAISLADGPGCKEAAFEMVSEAADTTSRLAAMIAMVANKQIKSKGVVLPVVDLLDKDGVVTAEAATILQTAEIKAALRQELNLGRGLETLAEFEAIRNTMFRVRTSKERCYTLYLPVVVEFGANQAFTASGSLVELVRNLFAMAIYHGKVVRLTTNANGTQTDLTDGVLAMMSKLVESGKLHRQASYGRKSLQAKAVGAWWCEVDKVYVRASGHYNSVYAAAKRTFKCNGMQLNGRGVALGRSPMTTPTGLTLCVIHEGHHLYNELSEFVMYMSIANYMHGGDYDGDLNILTSLHYTAADGTLKFANLGAFDMNTLIKNVLLRTGSTQLAEDKGDKCVHGEVYYGDTLSAGAHTMPKVTAKFLSHDTGTDKFEHEDGLIIKLNNSDESLHSMVGRVHMHFLRADLFITVCTELRDYILSMNPAEANSWYFNQALIPVLGEIYEIPLAGYDKGAFKFINRVLLDHRTFRGQVGILAQDKAKAEADFDTKRNKKLMDEAGMNTAYFAEVVNSHLLCGHIESELPLSVQVFGEVTTDGLTGAERASAECTMFLGLLVDLMEAAWCLSKSDYEKHGIVVDEKNFNEYSILKLKAKMEALCEGSAMLKAAVAKSTVLQPLFRYVETMRCVNHDAIPELNLCNTNGIDADKKDNNDDENNNDGGGSVPPVSPNTPSNGGGNTISQATMFNVEAPTPTSIESGATAVAHAKAWRNTLKQSIRALPDWKHLSDDQLVAVWIICKGEYHNVNLLGRAGSGKTFTVKFCRTVLEMMGNEVLTVASTGVAAFNAEGHVINTVGGLGVGHVLPEGLHDDPVRGGIVRKGAIESRNRVGEYIKRNGSPLVIFIDEISMITSQLLVSFKSVVDIATRHGRSVRYVCVGDYRQLLPVALQAKSNDAVAYTETANLAFQPAVFELHRNGAEDEGVIVPTLSAENSIDISLITNHRQATASGGFVDELNMLGDGVTFESGLLPELMDRVYILDHTTGKYVKWGTDEVLEVDQRFEENALHIYTRNKQIQAHNERVEKLALARGAKSRNFIATVEANGNHTIKDILRQVNPLQEVTTVYEGMKFMVRMNIKGTDLRNGTMGRVTGFDSNSITLETADGIKHVITRKEFPLPKNANNEPIGLFETVAVGHGANALTPWKVQGITVAKAKSLTEDRKYSDSVVLHVDTTNWRTHGLFYVACSRVEVPEQLYILVDGSEKIAGITKPNPAVSEFIKAAESNMHALMTTPIYQDQGEPADYVSIEVPAPVTETPVAETPVVADSAPFVPLVGLSANTTSSAVPQADSAPFVPLASLSQAVAVDDYDASFDADDAPAAPYKPVFNFGLNPVVQPPVPAVTVEPVVETKPSFDVTIIGLTSKVELVYDKLTEMLSNKRQGHSITLRVLEDCVYIKAYAAREGYTYVVGFSEDTNAMVVFGTGGPRSLKWQAYAQAGNLPFRMVDVS